MASGGGRRSARRRQRSDAPTTETSGSTRPTDFTERLEQFVSAMQSATSLTSHEQVALGELIDALSVLLEEGTVAENRD